LGWWWHQHLLRQQHNHQQQLFCFVPSSCTCVPANGRIQWPQIAATWSVFSIIAQDTLSIFTARTLAYNGQVSPHDFTVQSDVTCNVS
jgi:hypothetical protein